MVLINGMEADSVSVHDRGFLYGDGVFRTFRFENGIPLHWDLQYAKLSSDCNALGIDCPPESRFREDLEKFGIGNFVVKIIVTRGIGARGFLPEEGMVANRLVMTSPLPENPKREIVARLCDLRLSHQPRLAGIKHLNRLENVLARSEWRDPGISEGILLDLEGNVIEGTMSSLFFFRNGRLHAPDLSRCGVSGVQRKRVLEIGRRNGIETVTGHFGIELLMDADEIFLVNSVIGLWQVRRFEGIDWDKGQMSAKFREWLQ
ncbi:MAG: aminodeoxychorismate lyase [Burkholderiales bacterium]|nr:aminodeoxychorismate lyase [Burkholderiales bacterium]